jgi:hypothetical protein
MIFHVNTIWYATTSCRRDAAFLAGRFMTIHTRKDETDQGFHIIVLQEKKRQPERIPGYLS